MTPMGILKRIILDWSNDLCVLDGHSGFSSAVVANAEPAIEEVVLKNKKCIASVYCGDGLAETIEKFSWESETEA